MLAGVAVQSQVSVAMVGDILLHDRVEQAALDQDGNYDFDFIFSNTRDSISAADLAIVNQEVIIGGRELGVSGYPAFNAPVEIGDALSEAGFDVVCHATNHALDKGKKGLVNTLNYWEDAHPEMTVVGINGTQEQKDRVDIITKNGIRIAILNYTYGTNGISAPAGMSFAVDMLEEEKVKRDLEYAEANADFTIVCPHWGTEYNPGIDGSQKKWTKIFRDGGADLVIAECGALPGTVTDKPNAPHMEPEICARLAVEAGAGQMVLTHFGAGAYTSIPQRMDAVASARSIFPNLITGVDNLEIVL